MWEKVHLFDKQVSLKRNFTVLVSNYSLDNGMLVPMRTSVDLHR